ncbi:MAG: leucyl aminopeptidase [Candidatus Gracilibacteria bacterium]
MKFEISQNLKRTDVLFLPLYKEEGLSPKIKKILGNSLSKMIELRIKNNDFEGDEGQTISLFTDGEFCKKLVLVGLGKKEEKVPHQNELLGGTISGIAKKSKAEKISVFVNEDFESIAYGIILGTYEFTFYKKTDSKAKELKDVCFLTNDSKENLEFLKKLSAFENASILTRNLINTSAGDQVPQDLANEAKKIAKKYGMKVTILDNKKLKKLGCGGIIGVGQGAKDGPCMAFLEYKYKSNKKEPSIAFIGKGITFDSGGMNLKPSGHVETMKSDMSGAGTVLGTMQAIAELKMPGHFLGVIACAENALSDKAIHSGDVLKMYNGKTVEVVNTDAEGRLILADALSYTEKNFHPKNIIDIATLTGAVVYALGYKITGVLGNKDEIIKDVLDSSKNAHERFWQLPLDADFIKATKGDFTDLKNATDGVRAGTIMGAAFLQNFIEKTAWAHIDFAGTSWAEKPTPTTKYGATASGLRTLLELAIKHQG